MNESRSKIEVLGVAQNQWHPRHFRYSEILKCVMYRFLRGTNSLKMATVIDLGSGMLCPISSSDEVFIAVVCIACIRVYL